MSIELHTWNTPNGRKISIALEEMGLPYTVHPIDISKGKQFEPAFLAISPNNRIPAIVDPEGPGGRPISVFESGAILLYLGRKTGKFLPEDLRAQVPVLEWLMWQMGGFGPMPGQVHHFLQVENEQDRRYGLERYSKETRRLYGVLDRRLAQVPYAGGAEVSVADFAILGWAWRHERHKVDLADFPSVKRWYETMMARPGTARGFEVALS
ncbi:MAG: glutathione binding-like protein [Bradyrhizobium sp.]